MNILFVAPYVPSRIRVRPFQIIRELSRRHKVYVVALGELGGVKLEGADELLGLVQDLRVVPHSKLRGLAQSLVALPSPVPMCAAFCWSGAMRAAVEEMVSGVRFDVVHIEHLRAAHFASLCGGLPVVFDSVDCLAGLFRQMARSKTNLIGRLVMLEEAWKLERYEPRVLERFDRVVITSDSERNELTALNPKLGIDVVPNGVDTEYFAPRCDNAPPDVAIAHRFGSEGAEAAFRTDPPDLSAHSRRIVFSGKMSYSPNAEAALWFAEKVFPALRSKYSDVKLVIVGSGPPPEVAKLAEAPGITVTGYVDDIRPYLGSSTVAVVPMRVAVGVQNKILEAMAMGLPVVASPISTRALGEECPGVVQADGAEATVLEISRLLESPGLAAELGRAGRDEVVRRFSWESSVALMERIYEEAVAARK